MARTKWQPTVTFVATNGDGHEHTLHVFTKWIEDVSMQEPTKWIEDTKEIRMDDAVLTTDAGEVVVACDFILAMTGYEPDTSLLESIGAIVDQETKKPELSEHFETTVPGLFVIGTLCAGCESNVVFIENSREHGPAIVRYLIEKGKRPAEPAPGDSGP